MTVTSIDSLPHHAHIGTTVYVTAAKRWFVRLTDGWHQQ